MIRTAFLALLLTAAPAQAEPWDCEMTVSCQNIDCDGIEDRYGVIAADHEGQLFLTTPAGDRPVTRLRPQGSVPAAYAGAGGGGLGELLTITEDGQAILSIHGHDWPTLTTTIFGFCTSY